MQNTTYTRLSPEESEKKKSDVKWFIGQGYLTEEFDEVEFSIERMEQSLWKLVENLENARQDRDTIKPIHLAWNEIMPLLIAAELKESELIDKLHILQDERCEELLLGKKVLVSVPEDEVEAFKQEFGDPMNRMTKKQKRELRDRVGKLVHGPPHIFSSN